MTKKSTISALTAVILCFTVLFSPMGQALLLGDVNGDGKISAADARFTLRAAVGLETPTKKQHYAADVNNDGKITAADARLILRAAVGLEKFDDTHIHTAEKREPIPEGKDAEGNVIYDENNHKGICVLCDEEFIEPHEFGEAETTEEPTCEKEGRLCLTCKKCGYKHYEPIAALGHSLTEIPAVAPTCTTDGNNKYYKCETCGKYFSDEQGNTITTPEDEKLNAFGHDWSEWEQIDVPTCTEKGSKKRTCLRCNEVENQEIEPLGHDWGEWKQITAPSCIKAGLETKTCKRCNKVENRNVPALGHKFSGFSMDNGMICESCGAVGLPSFNILVNSIKGWGNTNRYANFSRTDSKINDVKCMTSNKWWGVRNKWAEDQLKKEMPNSTDYTSLVSDICVQQQGFPVHGKPFVCDLHDGDVKSVKAEKLEGIDFIKNLPDSYQYTVGDGTQVETCSLVKLKKAASEGSVYKVTVTLNEETYSSEGNNKPTKISKLYISDYEDMMKEISNGFKVDGMEEYVDSKVVIKSNLTVTYYFDAMNFDPVAAVYCLTMNPVIDLNMKVVLADVGTAHIDTTNTVNDYYFFNDYAKVK